MNPRDDALIKYLERIEVSNQDFKKAVLAALSKLVKTNEESVSGRTPFDQMMPISATLPIVLDYRNRKFIYIWSANALTLTLEDLGQISLSANAWTNISFHPGLNIFASGQASVAYVSIKQTDDKPT